MGCGVQAGARKKRRAEKREGAGSGGEGEDDRQGFEKHNQFLWAKRMGQQNEPRWGLFKQGGSAGPAFLKLLEDLEQDNIIERQFSQEVPETLTGVSGWIVKEGMMEEWQRRRQVLLSLSSSSSSSHYPFTPPLFILLLFLSSNLLCVFRNSLCYLFSLSLCPARVVSLCALLLFQCVAGALCDWSRLGGCSTLGCLNLVREASLHSKCVSFVYFSDLSIFLTPLALCDWCACCRRGLWRGRRARSTSPTRSIKLCAGWASFLPCARAVPV